MSARRPRNPLFSRSLQRSLTRTLSRTLSRTVTRTFGAIARTVVRASTKAIGKPVANPVTKRKPETPSRPASRRTSRAVDPLRTGMVIRVAGARCHQIYKPPGVKRAERLPMLVMLHGCTQDARNFAASSRMNRIAARERFMVLYPQQDRLSNLQGCWP